MHKALWNLCRISLSLQPEGPLLIKAGGQSADPTLPDMQFVRTPHPETGKPTIYIPGSSLKGVLRSFVEAILRSQERDSWWACDPFLRKDSEEGEKAAKENRKKSCAGRTTEREQKEKRRLASHEIYSQSCPACRLFGHTRLRGRLSCSDFFPPADAEPRTEVRTGVAISRVSQAVAQGPFDMEVATGGRFEGQIVLQNYTLWQLGLTVAGLRAMREGLLKVGFGKNRGFGRVKLEIREVTIREPRAKARSGTIHGVGAFLSEEEKERYGLSGEREDLQVPEGEAVDDGLYLGQSWRGEAGAGVEEALMQVLRDVFSG